MKALVGLLVAAALLVLGGLPALALVLDDDPSDHPGRPGWAGWAGWADRLDHDRSAVRPEGPFRGPLPPRVAKCLRSGPEIPPPRKAQPEDGVPPGAREDSLPDIPHWRDDSLRSFARCLRSLHGGPPAPGS